MSPTALRLVALCTAACTPTPPGKLPLEAPADGGGLDVDDTSDPGDTDDPSDTSDSADPHDSGDTGEVVPPWDDGPPPVVVLFIGDGMGSEHVRGAGLVGHGTEGSLFIETAPHIGLLQTASHSGYTDSAASATTMATGAKTTNGRIGRDRHGVDLEGLVDLARARGLSVGVVTTDRVTGATPASFLTHADDRYDTETIAVGLATEPPDVLLGGGAGSVRDFFDATAVDLVETAEALDAAAIDPARPLVGLFSEFELPFIADMEPTDPTPRLPALVSTALDHLLTDPDGTLLIVEGARIDHASHFNRTDAVFQEVLELDAAVQATVERLDSLEGRAVTVAVTADHECGGLTVREPTVDPDTGLPPVRWLWNDHTNRDVPVYGWGDAAAVFAGTRQHNSWVHAALDGALRSRAPAAPDVPRLADGHLDDLGTVLTTQTEPTDFGDGYNQLDGLRITADAQGLWFGIDGVFDERANAVVVWLDLDYGSATGVGADVELTDVVGVVDRILGGPTVQSSLPGLGFDAAVAQTGAAYLRSYLTLDTVGVRQFQPPRGLPEDLAWQHGIVNYDDGNVADRAPARDAGTTGLSEHGMEVFVGHDALWEGGLPASGATIAVVVTLLSADGSTVSNQALPPQPIQGDDGGLAVSRVVQLTVDATGTLTDGPTVVP